MFVGVALLIAAGCVIAAITVTYFRRPADLDPAADLPREQEHDPAWPNYFRRQHRLDAQALIAEVRSLVKSALDGPWWSRYPFRLITRPVLVLAAGFAAILILLFLIAKLVVRLGGEFVFWLAAAVVRSADALFAKVYRSQASCPKGYHVMDRPAYSCTQCGGLHRDIRPSRRGAVFRVCICGERLPTGVLRAAWQLTSVCQFCGEETHRGSAVLRDVRVPVFGEPNAGKTRLILAGFHELTLSAQGQGVDLEFADDSTRQRMEFGREHLAADHRTDKTQWELSPALSCRLGSGTTGALLHAFDAAGERFRGGESHDALRFLDEGHTLVFVVDPFAVPLVRELVEGHPRRDVIDEHCRAEPRNLNDVYGEVVSRIRTSGTETKNQRLAIVVTKADVLAEVGVTAPADSMAVKQWLYDGGLHNVTLAAEREFKEVRYFTVASVLDDGPSHDYAAAAPFLWALGTRGFGALGDGRPAPRIKEPA